MIATGAVASQTRGRDLFSFFRTPLPDFLSGNPADAPPIDPDSVRIMARMKWEMPRLMDGSVPGRSFVWGPKLSPRAPLYRASPSSATQPVPSNQDDSEYARTLLSNQGVPIPLGAVVAQPGVTNDQNMNMWSPSEDKAWEGTGMKHSVDDMQFWAPVLGNELATNAPIAGGSLIVGNAYFYRITAVTDTGETGSNTQNTGGTKHRVMLTVPTGGTAPKRTAVLRIRPRYLINSVRVYRCVATNGPTLPGAPTGSPPDGQANFYHRIPATLPAISYIYRWNAATSTWVNLNASWPYSPDYTSSDFGLLATLTPTGSPGPTVKPTLFAINGVLTDFSDAGQYGTPNQAITMPTISTATYDDDTWRCDRVATLVNVSTCPGYTRDIAAGQIGGPQGRFWAGSATRISFEAGLITKRDWDRNVIDHVMNWSFYGGVGSNTNSPPNGWWHDPARFAFPAQSSDGNRGDSVMTTQMQAAGCPSTALPLPEGARFRLPATFDLSTINTAGLTAPQAKLCMMVATALKHYGIVATDTGAGVNIHCGWPCTEDPTDPAIATYGSPRGGSYPDEEYDGRNGTTWRPGWPSEGAAFKPRKTSSGAVWDGPFPWDAMEVVRMGWGPGYQGAASDLSPCTTNAIACPLGGQ